MFGMGRPSSFLDDKFWPQTARLIAWSDLDHGVSSVSSLRGKPMFSNVSLCNRSTACAALNVGWLVFALAFGSLDARSEGLGGLGGAVGNAVGGALGSAHDAVGTVGGALNGALGRTSESRAPGSPPDDDSGPSNEGGAHSAARSGNWVGAPYVLKATRRSQDQDSCDDTFVDWIRGGGCTPNSPEVAGEALDQASYLEDNEPNVLPPAIQKQEPVGKKAASKQSVARLNVEKPAAEGPQLTIAPKPVPSKVVDKAQPHSSPPLSCDRAETIVGGYGFSDIKATDCDGQVLSFGANRDGKSFLITLNALNGELIQVRKRPLTTTPEG